MAKIKTLLYFHPRRRRVWALWVAFVAGVEKDQFFYFRRALKVLFKNIFLSAAIAVVAGVEVEQSCIFSCSAAAAVSKVKTLKYTLPAGYLGFVS